MYLSSSFRHNWGRLLKHSSDISTILTIVSLLPVVTRQWFRCHLYSAVAMLSLFTHLFSCCPAIVGGMLNAVSVFMLASCWYSVKMLNLWFWFGGCYPPFRDGVGRERKKTESEHLSLTFSSEGACFSPLTVGDLQMWAPKSSRVTLWDSLFCACVVSTMMPAYYILSLWKNKSVIVAHAAQDPGKLKGVIGVVGGQQVLCRSWALLGVVHRRLFGSNTPVFWSGIWLCWKATAKPDGCNHNPWPKCLCVIVMNQEFQEGAWF